MNLQISKKSFLSDMHYPFPIFRPSVRSIGLLLIVQQRVLKMLFTCQILLTCNCNCQTFFHPKHTLLCCRNYNHISAGSLQ